MAQHVHLETVLLALMRRLNESERLSAYGDRWVSYPFTRPPKFTVKHRDHLAEIAFLKSFIAWEMFLEESFVLYLLGKKAPMAARPHRKLVPSNRNVAEKLFIPEKRKYANWSVTDFIVERAEKCFQAGTEPYSSALTTYNSRLTQIKSIRNAIAHASSSTQESFKKIARDRLIVGVYPAGLTVGGFLSTTVPATHPPESFLENYLATLRLAATDIVPT
ncbi:MAG: hypothetical protein QOH41_3976 [Blastocatellia bacterium]|jgi:hypothetical protein|nr:hypothetical protein [Blastocatellia bacterium]